MDKTQALEKAAKLCSTSEKCMADIRAKLVAWQVPGGEHEAILAQLVADKFIDHWRYTQAFVNDKVNIDGWGRVKIAHHLRQKRIESRFIETALLDIDEAAYMAQLQKLIRRKAASIRAASPEEKRDKIATFAIGRGFETELVFDCLKQTE